MQISLSTCQLVNLSTCQLVNYKTNKYEKGLYSSGYHNSEDGD